MRKSVFVANVVVWAVVALVSAVFLVWYRSLGSDEVLRLLGVSAAMQFAMIYAGPLLYFGLGALGGAVVVWRKRVRLARWARAVLRAIGALFLLLLVVPLVTAVVPPLEGGLVPLLAVLLYLSLSAPVVIVLVGFAYGLGLAGTTGSGEGAE